MSLVVRKETDVKAVAALIKDKLVPAVGGLPVDVTMAAMLTMLLVSLKEDITADQVDEGVEAISGYIATWLTGLDVDLVVN